MFITPMYAAIFALILVFLSLRVIRLRFKLKLAFGDGKDKSLKRAMRVHGNFIEYVPMALLMMYFVELQLNNPTLVHGLGIALLISRCAHIYGVSQLKEIIQIRMVGMFLTFSALITAAFSLLIG